MKAKTWQVWVITKKRTPNKTEGKALPNGQKAKVAQVNEKPKAKYQVWNWASYNESLKQRGNITLWIGDDIRRAWRPDPRAPKKRGGQKEYADGGIECLLMVKHVHHLGYRQTEGFACSMGKLLGVELPIPDHTTLCDYNNETTPINKLKSRA